MNWLSLRNNRLKFKTSWKLLIILGGIYRIYLKWTKNNQRDHNMQRLDLETLGLQLIIPKILSWHC